LQREILIVLCVFGQSTRQFSMPGAEAADPFSGSGPHLSEGQVDKRRMFALMFALIGTVTLQMIVEWMIARGVFSPSTPFSMAS
jgi:hypothetical protein